MRCRMLHWLLGKRRIGFPAIKHLHTHTACNSNTPACPAVPALLKQTLSGAMSVARQLLPSAQAQLHSMSPAPHKSVRPLTGTQRRAQKASLQKAAGAAVQAAAEAGAQLPQRCAHCGQAAVGLRRCAQCRRAEASYCRWARYGVVVPCGAMQRNVPCNCGTRPMPRPALPYYCGRIITLSLGHTCSFPHQTCTGRPANLLFHRACRSRACQVAAWAQHKLDCRKL